MAKVTLTHRTGRLRGTGTCLPESIRSSQAVCGKCGGCHRTGENRRRADSNQTDLSAGAQRPGRSCLAEYYRRG